MLRVLCYRRIIKAKAQCDNPFYYFYYYQVCIWNYGQSVSSGAAEIEQRMIRAISGQNSNTYYNYCYSHYY
jgi:hypothetical protein